MSDPLIVALVYGAIKLITTGRHEQNARKMLSKLGHIERDTRAIKGHLGIEIGDDGKVLVLRRSVAAAAEYQDELAK